MATFDKWVEFLPALTLRTFRQTIHLPVVPETPPEEPKQNAVPENIDYDEIMKLFKKQEQDKQKNLEKLKEMGFNPQDFLNSKGGFNAATPLKKKQPQDEL